MAMSGVAAPAARPGPVGASAVLGTAIAVTPPLAVFFPLGLAALLVAAAAALLGPAAARRAALAPPDSALTAIALAFCLWAMLSAAWSSAPAAALSVSLRLA